jgi:hypothetical protein
VAFAREAAFDMTEVTGAGSESPYNETHCLPTALLSDARVHARE